MHKRDGSAWKINVHWTREFYFIVIIIIIIHFLSASLVYLVRESFHAPN